MQSTSGRAYSSHSSTRGRRAFKELPFQVAMRIARTVASNRCRRWKEPGMGPLSGYRVLELAGIGPGPFACMVLSDLGAEVLRVDRPGGRGLEGLPANILERGRRSAAIDLKHPEGAEVVLRLAEEADALVEGYRPGVAE